MSNTTLKPGMRERAIEIALRARPDLKGQILGVSKSRGNYNVFVIAGRARELALQLPAAEVEGA